MHKANVRSLQVAAQRLKEETCTLYPAYHDPSTIWYARILVAPPVVGYVFSPIDPIPEFFPVVGLLDEIIIVTLEMILARKMIPDEVLAECRVKSREVMRQGKKPVNRMAAVLKAVWLLLAMLDFTLAFRIARRFDT